ncbi:hypothetical protein B0J18DRAFT_423939 [Chaetomium sp. MPI-SDFR-AT-0129]|nr:hypothetical protein B0J18DRAFT_423939 [Chaetomium sp. MPI-SDFR-AT-0129]
MSSSTSGFVFNVLVRLLATSPFLYTYFWKQISSKSPNNMLLSLQVWAKSKAGKWRGILEQQRRPQTGNFCLIIYYPLPVLLPS